MVPRFALFLAAALLAISAGCASEQPAEVALATAVPVSTVLGGFDQSVCRRAPAQDTDDRLSDLLNVTRQREEVLVHLASDNGPLVPGSDVIERFGNAELRDRRTQSDAHLDGDLDDSELVRMAAARAAYLRAAGRYIVLIHELSETAGLEALAEVVETAGIHPNPIGPAEAEQAFNRMADDLEVACGLGFLNPDLQPAPAPTGR